MHGDEPGSPHLHALAATTELLTKILQARPLHEWPSALNLLATQSQQLQREEVSLRQALSQILTKRERERQRIETRRAELHLLIRKLREDIRARPPANLGERLSDEQTLEHLEKQFFALQADPVLIEQLAKATIDHQLIKHRSSVAVYRLGQSVLSHRLEIGTRFRNAVNSLERSLDVLGRSNHNVAALMEDLPAFRGAAAQ